ncbi:L-serine ammonia-lyase, iron-sulfur-dependent, subunit alpha, partial [Dysosmobacter welbionis]
GAADGRGGGRVSAHLPPRRAAGAVCHLPGPAAASRSPDAAGRRRHRCLHYGGRDPAAPPHPLRRLSDLRGCPPPGRRYLCAAGAAPRPPAGLGGTVSPPPAGPGPECFSGRRRPMRHGKTTALKCLPLATELLIVFLTADILWQLLCGRPPFSMWGFLLSGGLMTAGNSLFLQKPRRFWQILLLNVLLCAVWIPLLSRTLDLTYPPLLVIQVPLYLFPLCRGYHWGVTPVTVRHLHGAGEYMGLYGLFYLIVASFAPQLLDRVPVLLALLALDLLAVVGMRTSGRNTIRAGSPFGRLP